MSKKEYRGDPKKHKRIRNLSCYDLVHDKVCADISPEEIARWIQEDMFESTDIQRESLTRQLYRYKADLPPGAVVKEPPLYVKKAIEKLKRGVNEIEELEALYLLQLKRISIDAQTEERINKLFENTGKEISLAKDILNDMVKMKQELGILDKQADRLDVNMGGSVGKTVLNIDGKELDPEKKVQLGVVAEKLMSSLIEADEEEVKDAVNSLDETEENY